MSKLDEPYVSPTIYTSLNSLVMHGIEIDKNLRQPNYYSCINYNELKPEVFGIVSDLLSSQKVPGWLSQRIAWFYVEKYLNEVADDLIEMTNISNELESIDFVDSTEPKSFTRDKMVIYLRNSISKIIKEWQIKKSTQIKSNLLFSFARSEHSTNIQYSEFGIKNKRRTMEDKVAIIENIEILRSGCEPMADRSARLPTCLFGVFDGHCGVDCAMYVSKHLPMYLIQHPEFYNANDAHTRALTDSFEVINKLFTDKAKKESIRSGSTACLAILGSNSEKRYTHIDVAWCGDTRMGLVKNGQISFLTTEHKPDNEDEKARILAAGGNVSYVSNCWRVDGSLAVARSFGDIDYQPGVISEPEIAHFELEGDEDYLIIGCDGLWETLEEKEITTMVYEYALTAGVESSDVNIAEFLVRKAQSNGSMDNITAIFVLLKQSLGCLTKPA